LEQDKAMSAIEYDIKMEAADVEDPLRMGDLENMRPLPSRYTLSAKARHCSS
jgi:hypothetical protein